MSAKKILNISAIALLVLVNMSVCSYGGTDTFNPVTITTGPLTATGKGTPAQPDTTTTVSGTQSQTATPPPESYKPVTINTEELSATGKGAAGTPSVPLQKMPPTRK